jgi:hypothetical protein
MRDYTTLLETTRDQFDIVVDKAYEDGIHPRDCFDDSIDPETNKPYFDIDQMCRDIDDGDLDWFFLRTRVFYKGVELAEEFLGGCMYKDAIDVLTDGTAEDQIEQALYSAKNEAKILKDMFASLEV